MRNCAFGWLLAAGVLSLQAVHGATTRNWADGKNAGDLLAAENGNPAGAPAAGDTLNIARNVANNPVSGEFTFSADTPVFSAVTFARAYGKERSLNPGNGKTLKTTYLNFRYSDLFTIASGTYLVGDTFGVGNSTSSGDKTKLTIDGEGTYVKAAEMFVGIGSQKVAQSYGNVTITNGAVVDAKTVVGPSGGAENVLTVTGEGSRLYSTNDAVVVGSEKLQRLKKVRDENGDVVKDAQGREVYEVYDGMFWHSCNNVLTVADKAVMTAANVYLGSQSLYDITSTGNVLSVTGNALVDVADTLYVKGSNSVAVSGSGRVKAARMYVGRWSASAAAPAVGSCCEIGDGGRLDVSGAVYVGGEYSSGNVLSVHDDAVVETPLFYAIGPSSVLLSQGAKLIANDITVGYWSLDGVPGGGTRFEVGNGSRVVAGTRILIGGIKEPACNAGNELRVLAGGEITTPLIEAGQLSARSRDNRLVIEEGGTVHVRKFYMFSTNTAEVCGTLAVTNCADGASEIVIGRVYNATGDSSGSSLVVDGGELLVGYPFPDNSAVTNRPTFYIGHYQKQSDGNRVEVKNGGKASLVCSHLYVGAAGSGNSLIVAGEGSRLVHDATTSFRNVIIGAAGLAGIDNCSNSVAVVDGGYLETDAGIAVGNPNACDTVLTVDRGTVKVAQGISVGVDAQTVNSRLIVKNSASRISAKTLEVGPRSSIVFDLSDASSSEEALVKLTSAPSFAEGSRIVITSSNPNPERAPAFECVLISCDADMDFSNVEIVIDPASGLRRKYVAGGKTLAVCGGLRPGMAIVVR